MGGLQPDIVWMGARAPDGYADNANTRQQGQDRNPGTMNRNVLYLIIGALAVVAAIFGYQLHQERQKTTGIEINVGKSGISIEKK